jgi:hypothetical protein
VNYEETLESLIASVETSRMNKPDETFAKVRRDLLAHYERGVAIDISQWVARYPELRDDLLSYWVLLRGTRRIEPEQKTTAVHDRGIAEQGLRQAVEALALGRSWLADAIEPEAETQIQIGEQLQAVRRSPRRGTDKPPVPFRRAAVYAWVVVTLEKNRGTVSRLAAQKVVHLLERGLELGLFVEHKLMPLGPYDPTARYKDAEPIATRQKWLTVVGTQLTAGTNSNAVDRYARNYVRASDAARALVTHLAELSDAQLETWATVEWVARELVSARHPYDAKNIRRRLAEIPKWAAKLRKPHFSEGEVAAALEALVRLRIIDSTAKL